MLWVFGRVSNQKVISRVREEIRGNLLAVRLYQHDVGVVLRLQGRILRATLVYFRYSFRPILILIVPVFLILAQLNLYFSLRPLQEGETALVKAKLHSLSIGGADEPQLEASEVVRVETPGVRIEAEREVAWRIRAVESGHHRVIVRRGSEKVEKALVVGGRWDRVSHLRTDSLLDLLLYPGEDAIFGEAGINSIEVTYPSLRLRLFGWDVHWIVLFLVISLASAFILKRPMGVEI
jgi:hypothetical protein